jgi:hypothetical protein
MNDHFIMIGMMNSQMISHHCHHHCHHHAHCDLQKSIMLNRFVSMMNEDMEKIDDALRMRLECARILTENDWMNVDMNENVDVNVMSNLTLNLSLNLTFHLNLNLNFDLNWHLNLTMSEQRIQE